MKDFAGKNMPEKEDMPTRPPVRTPSPPPAPAPGPPTPKRSALRTTAYIVLGIFLLTTAFAAYQITLLVQATETVTEPIADLVRQIMVPATPVILVDPTTIVLEINELARLETASMTMQKIVTVERNSELLGWTFEAESLLFVAQGDVIAGVDLAKMTPQDVQVVDPTTVMIHLPEAEIFIAALDNDNSYVADRDVGFLASADPQLETQVRQMAENAILNEALERDILGEAEANAETAILNFLRAFEDLGIENIIFTDTPPPPAVPWQQEIPKGMTGTATPGP